MRKRLTNSLFALLGREELETPEAVMERVRHAMLAALDEFVEQDKRDMERQILFTTDIESLWYIRPALMVIISASQGESVARECVAQITELFIGHHPGATPSKFGSL
jgi:hypothetical protein